MSVQEQVTEIRQQVEEDLKDKVETPNISEVILGYKEVEIPVVGKIRIYRPDHFVNDAADKVAAALQLKMLQDEENELALEDQLRILYQKRGLWDDTYDARMSWLRDRVAAIAQESLFELKGKRPINLGGWIEANDEEGNVALRSFLSAEMQGDASTQYEAYKIFRTDRLIMYRTEYKSLYERYARYFGGSIENFALSEKQIYLIQQLCKHEDGTLVWASTNDFKSAPPHVVNAATTEAMRFWRGHDNEDAEHFFDSLLGDLM